MGRCAGPDQRINEAEVRAFVRRAFDARSPTAFMPNSAPASTAARRAHLLFHPPAQLPQKRLAVGHPTNVVGTKQIRLASAYEGRAERRGRQSGSEIGIKF